MKKILILAIVGFAILGFVQAQQTLGVQWEEAAITYSTGGDSIVTGTTISSYAIDLRKEMTKREDPTSYGFYYGSRKGISYKMPTKLSFQWSVEETLTNSDSINTTKKIQFSADSTTWTTAIALDTLLSTTADTNATVSEYELMTTFPRLQYLRIQSVDASASGDTSSIEDKVYITY